MNHRRRPRTSQNRPLISHATILIFSGFLIGLVSSRLIDINLQVTIMAAGVVGILSFIGLDHLRSQQQQLVGATEQRNIEGRLAKHVDRCTPHDEVGPEDHTDVEVPDGELQTAS